MCNSIYMMTKNWQNQSMDDRNQKQDTLGMVGGGVVVGRIDSKRAQDNVLM